MDECRFVLELKFHSCFLCLDKLIKSLFVETVFFISMFSSNPLFSFIITFYTLVFLYLPHLFLKIVLSPVLILTGILLLTILRLGATQKSQHEEKKNHCIHEAKEENGGNKNRKEKQSISGSIESDETESLKRVQRLENSCNRSEFEQFSEMGFESSCCFVEWNVRAPLEVIYEEQEGEETEDGSNDREENRNMGITGYPSLSRFYPESDSDSSSESEFPATGDCGWDSQEDICYRWDEEDREGLIEIALDGSKMMKEREMEYQYEEDNLIEIDISPTRYKEMEALSGEIRCN